ncbi:MAG: two-component response regulator [Tardiphaga sp.]|nr:two-component response regulator [Tardiphaga sp.]
MAAAPRIACVDDDKSVCEALVGFLKAHGVMADAYPSAEAFLQAPDRASIWCVVSDVQLPGLSGLQLQARLAAQGDRLPFIFVTAFPDERVRGKAVLAGAVGFLKKPVKGEQLLGCIEAARAGPKD